MNFIEIKPEDIQAKKTIGESCDTRVRKAWSLQMSEFDKDRLATIPGLVRQQLYRSFDYEVQEIWVNMMKETREKAIADGAKYIKVSDGISRLEDAYCTNTDELLILAAQKWLTEFAKQDIKN